MKTKIIALSIMLVATTLGACTAGGGSEEASPDAMQSPESPAMESPGGAMESPGAMQSPDAMESPGGAMESPASP